jgi:FkbM family methyltransferase
MRVAPAQMNLSCTAERSGLSSKWSKLQSQKEPLRFLASRLLWHSGLSHLFTFRCGSYRLRFYPSACSATLWLDPDERLQDEKVLRTLLTEGDHVIDVGANIGALTLAAAGLVGPTGRVYSIEAHPRTYRYLVGNVRLNRARNVRAFSVACGRENGIVTFSDKTSDDQNAVCGEGLGVPLCRLDDLIPETQRIALLKIDVEGYEKFVLEGAMRLLPRVESIYFESYQRHFHAFGYRLQDINRYLRGFGFTIFRRSGEKVTDDYESVQCENLLARRL